MAAQVSGLFAPVKPVWTVHTSHFRQAEGQNRAFSRKINMASGVGSRLSLGLKLSRNNGFTNTQGRLKKFSAESFLSR